MFTCTACLRRAFRTLTLETSPPASILSTRIPYHDHVQRNRNGRVRDTNRDRVSLSHDIFRGHATYDSLRKGHHKRVLRMTLAHTNGLVEPNKRRKGPGAMTRGEIKDAIARKRNRENALVIKTDSGDAEIQRRLKKEVDLYHKDPLSLAKLVQKRLGAHEFKTALNIVRASEGVVAGDNIVSWNHLIDYCMALSETDRAWRLYNELKKRGHQPDAHTYTIMLRGFSANVRKTDAAEKAVSIYNSMFAPNSRVTPNTVHTNAVLNVCARKRDLDSMWAIAGRMPNSGPAAPDRWTFTTILNAIRDDATVKAAQLLKDPDSVAAKGQDGDDRQTIIFEEALKDARKLWGDIIYKWRKADLIVDELLVCAMGRLILGCGSRSDFVTVFDLVDQTMNTTLKEGRNSLHLPAPEHASTESVDSESELSQIDVASPADAESLDKSTSSLPFDDSLAYAMPSNNTLSMLMEAALALKDMQTGKSYWHLLTTPNGPFKITPDANNIIAYLRLLRVSRASKTAWEVLSNEWPKEVADKLYKRGTFVVAMSTCIRDKNNPGVFDTADKLLDLMEQKLDERSLGAFNRREAEMDLSYKERRSLERDERANIDDKTFGEQEAAAELQRSKHGFESLPVDPKALRMYVDLGLITTKGWHEGLKNRTVHDVLDDGDIGRTRSAVDEKFSRNPKSNHALRALRRLSPMLGQIRRLATMSIEEMEHGRRNSRDAAHAPSNSRRDNVNQKYGQPESRVAENLDDLMELLRTAVSGYDRVIMMAERFEDERLAPLDQNMIRQFRNDKRMASAFLTRTKDDMARVRAKKYEFTRFKTMNRGEEEEDEIDHDDDDTENVTSGSKRASPRQNEGGEAVRHERQISRQIRQVYEDTDRDLDRVRSLSRRQRNERTAGVKQRLERRGLINSYDYGVVDDNLEITHDREATEKRMRDRAFGIHVER